MRHFLSPSGQPEMMRKNFMRRCSTSDRGAPMAHEVSWLEWASGGSRKPTQAAEKVQGLFTCMYSGPSCCIAFPPYKIHEFGTNPASHNPDYNAGQDVRGIVDIQIEPGERN